MYGLTKEEKLDFIINKSKELGITANDYGQNSEISTMGAHNILTGKSKNPRTKNLNIMIHYLESKVLGTQIPDVAQSILRANEPKHKYLDLESLAKNTINNHEELMKVKIYELFIETISQKRAIEILNSLKSEADK